MKPGLAERDTPGAPPRVTLDVADRIARITIRNPARRNALTISMWNDLKRFGDELAARPDVRVAVIRGEGETAFASGADISEFGDSRRSADQADEYHRTLDAALTALRNLPFPLVARVHGYCVGAGSAIAAACDLRYLDDAARFGVPAVKLGIGYNPAWIHDLATLVGKATAAEIMMTGQFFDARKALRCGFANEVLPAGELEAFVEARLSVIAAAAPLSTRAAKLSLREVAPFDRAPDWTRAIAAERQCGESRDYQRALAAFAEKRRPEFEGN